MHRYFVVKYNLPFWHCHRRQNESVHLHSIYPNTDLHSASNIDSSLYLDISPADGVIFDGTQHKTVVGLLRPNQTRVFQRSICFVMGGSFDVSWRVENVIDNTILTEGRLHLNVQYQQ